MRLAYRCRAEYRTEANLLSCMLSRGMRWQGRPCDRQTAKAGNWVFVVLHVRSACPTSLWIVLRHEA
jgi:hypothetical protein